MFSVVLGEDYSLTYIKLKRIVNCRFSFKKP